MNGPLFLENSSGRLGWVLPVFTEEKIQEQIKEYVVSKCKTDEYEDVGVAIRIYGRDFECLLDMHSKKAF